MLARLRLAAALAGAVALPSQNRPPAAPTVLEPAAFAFANPFDVHMRCGAFQDPDPGDQHAASDWEIWSVSPQQLAWRAAGAIGSQRTAVQLGDGTFVNAHAGWTRLFAQTAYLLRVRHRDDSGDPGSEWGPWTNQAFTTAAANQVFALELDGVGALPLPAWTMPGGSTVDLPVASLPPSLRLESDAAQVLLRITAAAASGNTIAVAPPLPLHRPVRAVLDAGSAPLQLPPTDLLLLRQGGCRPVTVRLPAVNLGSGQQLVLWIGAEGATYVGSAQQTAPSFQQPSRNLLPPYAARQPGYSIDVVAQGLQLPVNLAFVPQPGPNPGDPKFYVAELYGSVKTVTNDGTLLTYAANLLNYAPSGVFPGDGEQGLTGLAVDPLSGDVFAALLHEAAPGQRHPRIVRLSSSDGGRSASSQQVILDLVGEQQGQSHQISRLEIVHGELYCHNGDGFVAATARSLQSYRGKVLRLQLDGAPVAGNPFFDGGVRDARDYVFAYGLRNPFGGAWRALDDSRYVVENGPTIDRFARLVAGRDYGWNGTTPSMTTFALHTWSPAVAPVNLAFVQPQSFGGSGFPAAKMDHAFVTESGPTYAAGQQADGKRITEWVLDAGGNLLQGPLPFVDYVGDGRATVCGLAAGPDGLYFTDLYLDLGASAPAQVGGAVLRVRYGAGDDCDADGESDRCQIASNAVPDCNQNLVPDGCDLRAGTSLDFDGNGVPDECDPLAASRDRVSAAAGGRVDFALRAGAGVAGRLYALLGTLSGTAPGQQFGGVRLPLNPDVWFGLSIGAANSAVLVNTFGVFDAQGRAGAALVVPPVLATGLLGATLHHAWLAYDPASAQFTAASNAVPLRIDP